MITLLRAERIAAEIALRTGTTEPVEQTLASGAERHLAACDFAVVQSGLTPSRRRSAGRSSIGRSRPMAPSAPRRWSPNG
jgi:hypothetical protein